LKLERREAIQQVFGQGSQPTYEDLKLHEAAHNVGIESAFAAYLRGFETTIVLLVLSAP